MREQVHSVSATREDTEDPKRGRAEREGKRKKERTAYGWTLKEGTRRLRIVATSFISVTHSLSFKGWEEVKERVRREERKINE